MNTFSKTLTNTDADMSGSHSNGISIPKSHAYFFGTFSAEVLNPSKTVSILDRSGRKWNLIAYWYNGRVLGQGTRDEYRLAGEATAMLRALDLGPGDTIEFVQELDGTFSLNSVDPVGADPREYLPSDPEGLPEGAATSVTVNRYERSRANRDACIARHGSACACCGMRFSESYGDGELDSLIHAHHLIPVSQLNGSPVDPVTEMIPVCPNCHAVIHSRGQTPRSIDEVRRMISP